MSITFYDRAVRCTPSIANNACARWSTNTVVSSPIRCVGRACPRPIWMMRSNGLSSLRPGRLETAPPADERKFLLGVAVNMAKHARRSLARRREVLIGQLPDRAEPLGTPEHLVERNDCGSSSTDPRRDGRAPSRGPDVPRARGDDIWRISPCDSPSREEPPRPACAGPAVSGLPGEIEVTWGEPRGWFSPEIRRRCGAEGGSALGQALLEAGASAVECGTTRDADTLAALGLSPESLSQA